HPAVIRCQAGPFKSPTGRRETVPESRPAPCGRRSETRNSQLEALNLHRGTAPMAAINPRALIEKLNTTSNRALQAAAGLCLSRTHYHVEVEHRLLKLIDGTGHDLAGVLRH